MVNKFGMLLQYLKYFFSPKKIKRKKVSEKMDDPQNSTTQKGNRDDPLELSSGMEDDEFPF